MDAVVSFAVLLGVSVAAHMFVAYVWAPKAAVRRLKAYLEREEFSETITTRVGPALVAWIRTEDGAAAMDALVAAAGERIVTRLTSWLQGQAGGAAREGQAKAERVALAGLAIKTGNPVWDGVIAAMPNDLKRGFIRKVVGSVRGATEEELGISEGAAESGWR